MTSVMLDVHFEKPYYKNVEACLIDSPFICHDSEALKVNIPSCEDLLGDKLTAFAPHTIGVPYEKSGHSYTKEVIKQLFDIGCLFPHCENFFLLKTTFETVAKRQLKYRSLEDNISPVLEDIITTSLTLLTRGTSNKQDFDKLLDGIKKIKSFIFSETYNIDKAINHSAKAAYLAFLIKNNADKIELFDPNLNMSKWSLDVIREDVRKHINRLRKIDPEAFFYWYKILSSD